MSNVLFYKIIRVAAVDPSIELNGQSHYRIRILYKTSDRSYAVAAVRCENQREVHWISGSMSTPLQAVKMMLDGFQVCPDASEIAQQIIQRLLAAGKIVEHETANAVAA